MTTVEGLFGAGNTMGGAPHKFSSGSFAEERLAGISAARYIRDLKGDQLQIDDDEIDKLKQTVFQPLNGAIPRYQSPPMSRFSVAI